MYSLALLAFVSFLLALILTPVIRNLFRSWGLVDCPDDLRKFHAAAMPRAGGVPLLLAYLGAFAILLASPLAGTRIVESGFPVTWRIFPAAALVFAVGLIDDITGLKPWQKLAGQMIAASVAFLAGIQITAVGGVALPAWLSLPLT